MSPRRGLLLADSSIQRVAYSIATPRGMLTTKMARQSIQSVSTPPSSGPMANEAPMVAP